MRFTLTDAQEAWVAEIREFLDEHVTVGLIAEVDEYGIEANGPHARELRRRLSERGWQGLNWPTEYGGLGRTAIDEYLLISELEARGIPSLVALPIAVTSLGPTILRHGTEANRHRWIPGIISGEVNMALGYSEPEAGTDLASLRTKAVLDGDQWVINGQKIWNTAGHFANHQWLAVRTEPDAPKHRGISVIIVPNDTPGITITPIDTWGDYRTNQIFFDDVRVPADHLIGERGAGWRYITSALDFERMLMTGFIAAVRRGFDALVDHARRTSIDGQPILAGPGVGLRLAELDRDLELCRLMGLSTAAAIDRGEQPAAEAAMLKVFGSELQARVARVGTEILGPAGQLGRGDPDAPLDGAYELLYRQAPVMRFAAGTNEVQRDLIARGLGLPRGA
jgi:alkylation response protein AidB-like acyl-CoA dehydrogenase